VTKRTAAEQLKKPRRIQPGDHDVASRAAYHARVPICGRHHPENPKHACTRAAGHHEGTHPTSGSDHVATGIGYVALAVWL